MQMEFGHLSNEYFEFLEAVEHMLDIAVSCIEFGGIQHIF